MVDLLEKGFNPLKSGQCLLIKAETKVKVEKKAQGFNPLKSGQCLLIGIEWQEYQD